MVLESQPNTPRNGGPIADSVSDRRPSNPIRALVKSASIPNDSGPGRTRPRAVRLLTNGHPSIFPRRNSRRCSSPRHRPGLLLVHRRRAKPLPQRCVHRLLAAASATAGAVGEPPFPPSTLQQLCRLRWRAMQRHLQIGRRWRRKRRRSVSDARNHSASTCGRIAITRDCQSGRACGVLASSARALRSKDSTSRGNGFSPRKSRSGVMSRRG